MSVDFRQLQEQVRSLGLEAVRREQVIRERRQLASELLNEHAQRWQALRQKVQQIVDQFDPNLRCALPVEGGEEALNARRETPAPLTRGMVIAADGSQINPDRHAEVEFCLVNVGAIQLRIGSADPPVPVIVSDLIYGDRLQTPGGALTEAHVALMRDTAERKILAKLSAAAADRPLVTFTDGPLELWGAKDGDAAEFGRRLDEYQQALAHLRDLGAATAGYVDSPTANLVVRLLEVAMTPEDQLAHIRESHPLQGATDLWLFSKLLAPWQRSAVFAIQSGSINRYRGDLSLHFFYLHTGRGRRPLARVEIPAWVAGNPELVDALHATLVQQCRVLGTRAYPYLLHRAHEVALVSLAEKDQVTQMIVQERLRRGLEPGEKTQKQSVKDLPGRTRY